MNLRSSETGVGCGLPLSCLGQSGFHDMAKKFEAGLVEFALLGVQGCTCCLNVGENCHKL